MINKMKYMPLPYIIKIIPYENGGYFAKVEELERCITRANSWQELKEMIENAMKCWFKVAIEESDNIPLPKIFENEHNTT